MTSSFALLFYGPLEGMREGPHSYRPLSLQTALAMLALGRNDRTDLQRMLRGRLDLEEGANDVQIQHRSDESTQRVKVCARGVDAEVHFFLDRCERELLESEGEETFFHRRGRSVGGESPNEGEKQEATVESWSRQGDESGSSSDSWRTEEILGAGEMEKWVEVEVGLPVLDRPDETVVRQSSSHPEAFVFEAVRGVTEVVQSLWKPLHAKGTISECREQREDGNARTKAASCGIANLRRTS